MTDMSTSALLEGSVVFSGSSSKVFTSYKSNHNVYKVYIFELSDPACLVKFLDLLQC